MAIDGKIAFIGAGNMAAALIHGLLEQRVARPEQLIACDVRPEALATLAQQHGIVTTEDNRVACTAEIVVLSVKPQVFPSLLSELAPLVGPASLVLSIAAGVPLIAIESQLVAARVIRAMPNTPALVSAGATALAPGERASQEDLALARVIFESVGVVVEIEERLMDAVTALSGSGPAYLFYVAEALVTAGQAVGLPPEIAKTLALQTVYGAAKLLHESADDPTELRRKVTSPGGTTHAGVTRLEQLEVRKAFEACVIAARDRGKQLGDEALAKLGV